MLKINFSSSVIYFSDVDVLKNEDQSVRAGATGLVEVLRNNVFDGALSGRRASDVDSITITGGTGANHIDLRGVTTSTFTNVSVATMRTRSTPLQRGAATMCEEVCSEGRGYEIS